jgi:hypothetical protein
LLEVFFGLSTDVLEWLLVEVLVDEKARFFGVQSLKVGVSAFNQLADLL